MDNFCGPERDRGTLGGMTFEDLPQNWPTVPLGEDDFTADVLDLCVTNRDRLAGGLSLLLCRRDDTLAQPVFVGEIIDDVELLDITGRTLELIVDIPEVAGVVVGIARPEGAVNDHDRAVHQRAVEVCRHVGIRLLGTFLVTTGGVTCLPAVPELASGAA